MKFDFRDAAALGRSGRGARGREQGVRQRASSTTGLILTIRRGERWAVMGRNGAGKTTLLKMVAGALAPDAGEVRLGASLKLGYFAQQSLDVLDPRPHRHRAAAEGLPARRASACCARWPAPFSSPATMSTRRSARSRAARRRGWCWRACCSTRRTSWCSTSRPTTSIWRPRKCSSQALDDFEGTMLFVSHDRSFLRGLEQSRARARRRERDRRCTRMPIRVVRRVRRAHRPRSARRARLRSSDAPQPRHRWNR